jgi:hypothetical protein
MRRVVEVNQARPKSGSALRLVFLGLAVGASILAIGATLLAAFLLRIPGL